MNKYQNIYQQIKNLELILIQQTFQLIPKNKIFLKISFLFVNISSSFIISFCQYIYVVINNCRMKLKKTFLRSIVSFKYQKFLNLFLFLFIYQVHRMILREKTPLLRYASLNVDVFDKHLNTHTSDIHGENDVYVNVNILGNFLYITCLILFSFH